MPTREGAGPEERREIRIPIAGETLVCVLGHQVELRQALILRELECDLPALDLALRHCQLRAVRERLAHRLLDVDVVGDKISGPIGGLDRELRFRRQIRAEHEVDQEVLGGEVVVLRRDARELARGDAGLGLRYLDLRDDPHLILSLGLLEQGLRRLEALLLDAQLLLARDQAPVGALDVADGVHHLAAEILELRFVQDARGLHAGPRLVPDQAAQQRDV